MTEGSWAEHAPVLLDEAVEALSVRSDGKYVDATFGRGGHSGKILESLGRHGGLLAMDRDPDAIEVGQRRFGADPRFRIFHGVFSDLGARVKQVWPGEKIDGVLMDLGVSSPQIDSPERGFSFLNDGPLDMRMDPSAGQSAAQWLASASEQEISDVLRDYGEERFARRIARALVRERAETEISTTGQLAEIVAAHCPTREPGKHPATRTFQAIRIRVNEELAHLEEALAEARDALAPGGRLVVISFHSLEDRIVKRFIRREVRGEELPRRLPVTGDRVQGSMRSLGRPTRATQEEIARNPRSRSAVMRVAEKAA